LPEIDDEPVTEKVDAAEAQTVAAEVDSIVLVHEERGEPRLVEPDPHFIRELALFGAIPDLSCYQCATCSASCSISPDESPFPRKEVLWVKWGLRDRLMKDLDIWGCYYCGDCSSRCPRHADPGEIMMALRRYMTAQYDWTGLSRFLYTSWIRELGAVVSVGLVVVGLFYLSGAFAPERMITDHVSVNTFAPVHLVHYADWVMAAILSFFLLTNTFRMWRIVMKDEKIPLSIYLSNLKTFVVHATTQKKWRDCAEPATRTRWLKHFLFVIAYVSIFTLVMFFLEALQVDTSRFTWVSILGYFIAFTLLYVSGDAMVSRLRKREPLHQSSHDSDWMFLILLFLTALTGILMHFFRIMDWPLSTYYMYVIHLAIAVPMLVLEVPFMKWAHLMYRPLALYLKEVKESASAMGMKA
jgi:quinone-modifying oxidoreductase subunit QmoC